MADNLSTFRKRLFWVPLVCLLFFAILLRMALPQLDRAAIIAVVSVVGGGLAGVIGSFIPAIITLQRAEKESEIKLKEYASTQALELTKLEIELRLKEGKQHQLLAAAKIYREFYKGLFDLYESKTWPNAIAEQGLINRYDFSGQIKKQDDTKTT